MSGQLQQILEWVQREGEVMALARLRLKILPESVKEGIFLDEVTPQTKCSETYLEKVRKIAAEVTGKPCPH